MRWAEASGITIPEIELIPVAEISGLPPEASTSRRANGSRLSAASTARWPASAFTSRTSHRFLASTPSRSTTSYNYETLANLVYKLAGESELDEFIRRLVFVVASGNGDAHLKNWSLIYSDGVNARLSPAYDFVSTIQYKADDQLALNLARSKRWQDVTRESFLRLARKIGEDETRMADRLEPRQGRHHGRHGTPHAAIWVTARQHSTRISHHLARVPLFSTSAHPSSAA
jgi:serine/threonine-protein kinase HipA